MSRSLRQLVLIVASLHLVFGVAALLLGLAALAVPALVERSSDGRGASPFEWIVLGLLITGGSFHAIRWAFRNRRAER